MFPLIVPTLSFQLKPCCSPLMGEEDSSPLGKMLWARRLGALPAHVVSMMPGGAHRDSEMTSLENEDRKGSQELA